MPAIYTVVKYHKTESGETSSAIKKDSYEEALKEFHQLATNYISDKSVLKWSLAIVEPTEMKVVKREKYPAD